MRDMSEQELERARTLVAQLHDEAAKFGLRSQESAIGLLADGNGGVVMTFDASELKEPSDV